MSRLSMGTAYVSLALLALSLVLGPINVLRRRPNPISTDLRRDVGIWGALTAVAHTIVGLQVHSPGQPWLYFIWPQGQNHLLPFRYDTVGASNYTGLASLVFLLMLLTLSNDAALRRLGPVRWKALQRWNYAGFALLVVHAVIYQLRESRTLPWQALVVGAVVVVVALQFMGRHRLRAEVRQRDRDPRAT